MTEMGPGRPRGHFQHGRHCHRHRRTEQSRAEESQSRERASSPNPCPHVPMSPASCSRGLTKVGPVRYCTVGPKQAMGSGPCASRRVARPRTRRSIRKSQSSLEPDFQNGDPMRRTRRNEQMARTKSTTVNSSFAAQMSLARCRCRRANANMSPGHWVGATREIVMERRRTRCRVCRLPLLWLLVL
jgi:hypothetical protein